MKFMNVLPIVPQTIELITKLNNGVRPEIAEGDTFYVYHGEDEHAEIVTKEEIKQSDRFPEYMTAIMIYFVGNDS